jgi:hypothetical protein
MKIGLSQERDDLREWTLDSETVLDLPSRDSIILIVCGRRRSASFLAFPAQIDGKYRS